MPMSPILWMGMGYCWPTQRMHFFKRGRRKMFLCRASHL